MATILVAEDESDLLEVLRATLEACGHKVATARDGEGARRLIARVTFDCVILDVLMPKIHGVKLLQLIRKSKKHQNLPVCLMTANPQERDRLLQKDGLEADVLLTKPFGTMDLMRAVRTMTEAGTSQPDASGRRLKTTLPGHRHTIGI